jgi:hypothetical protein
MLRDTVLITDLRKEIRLLERNGWSGLQNTKFVNQTDPEIAAVEEL